jgi:cold shock CspA family protein
MGMIENFVVKDGIRKFGFILYDSQRIFFHMKEGNGELFEYQEVTFDAVKDPFCTKLKALNVRPSNSQIMQGRVTFVDQRTQRGFIQPLDPGLGRIQFTHNGLAGNGCECPKIGAAEIAADAGAKPPIIPLEEGCLVEYEMAREMGRQARASKNQIALAVRVVERSDRVPCSDASEEMLFRDVGRCMERSMERSRPPPVTTTRRRHSRSDNSPDSAQSAPIDTSGIKWRPQPQTRRHSWREGASETTTSGLGGVRRSSGSWRRGSRTEAGSDLLKKSPSSGGDSSETRYAKGPGTSPGFQLARSAVPSTHTQSSSAPLRKKQ